MSSYIYKFQGTVTNIYSDEGGLADLHGYSVGSSFFVEYLIDFGRPAVGRTQSGELVDYPLAGSDYTADSYFATLLRGDQLLDPAGWRLPDMYYFTEYYIAGNIYYDTISYGLVIAGPNHAYISVFGDEIQPNIILPWSVGYPAIAKSYGESELGRSEIWADVTLVSITQIPEPAAAALIFGWIAFIILFLRRSARR